MDGNLGRIFMILLVKFTCTTHTVLNLTIVTQMHVICFCSQRFTNPVIIYITRGLLNVCALLYHFVLYDYRTEWCSSEE